MPPPLLQMPAEPLRQPGYEGYEYEEGGEAMPWLTYLVNLFAVEGGLAACIQVCCVCGRGGGDPGLPWLPARRQASMPAAWP